MVLSTDFCEGHYRVFMHQLDCQICWTRETRSLGAKVVTDVEVLVLTDIKLDRVDAAHC